MCFSAEASFTAAIVLGAIGGATLRNCSSKPYFFLAAIPFLFAIQQLSEGILWLELKKNFSTDFFFIYAKKTFLTFAFLIWPIWIPLSLALTEKISWRRTLIYLDLACGILLSLLHLSFAIQQEISVQIANHSLQYVGQVPSQMILYPFIVLLPCFISSLKNIWIFGSLITLGYAVAYYFYTTTFVSVWCFFSALVSMMIYKIIKDCQFSFKKSSSNTVHTN
jgi:hypothetical protein